MPHRGITRIVAAGVLGLAGIGVGCGDSPSSPTPPPASMAPAPVTPVGLTLRSVSPSSGPTSGGDSLRISGTGFQAGVAVTIDGAAAAVTTVTDTYVDASTVAHVEGAVDIVVANPDGESKTLAASYTFANTFSVDASPTAVAPGGALTVSWHMPAGRDCRGGGDWIAIYRVGDPDATGAANGHSDLWYEHVCGLRSGAWTIKAPAEPGEYEFRLMVGGGSVARSSPVTVG
jgi:IPT/TIG domain-containing protein